MALTTEFIGSIVTTAENTTDWANQTISAVEQWDLRIQGLFSNGFQASNKDGWGGYVMPAGSYDFTPGGANEGDHVYIWMSYLSMFNLEDVLTTGGGLYLIVGSSTSDYKAFCVADSNTSEKYNGGWKLWVIDPSKDATWEVGTPNMAAVTFFGVGVFTNAMFRADNLFIDAIKVGSGIRAYGTGTVDSSFQDILDDDMGTEANRWGILQEQDGIIYSYGRIEIGDNIGSSDTTFSDSGRIIQWVSQEYYDNTGTWVPLTGDNLFSFNVVDSGLNYTSFTDGVIVGSDGGRSGSTIVGSELVDTAIYLGVDSTSSATDINLYGTAFKNCRGGITMIDDPDHVFYGGSVIGCGQFDPVGSPILRNITFAETIDTTAYNAALLWNENIDIQSCSFIANEQAIQHDTTATVTYTNLTFSGNDYDVLFLDIGVLTITVDGGTIPTWIAPNGGSVSLPSSITLTMTVKDAAGDPINLAYAYIDDDDASPFIMNKQTNASGIASETWTGGAVADSIWRVRKYGYKHYVQVVDIGGIDISIPVTLIADPQQT